MAKYFSSSEFDCRDNCGLNNIDDRLVRSLDRAREKAGIPFIIESGSRCPAHNEKVGGKPNSSHLHGLAVDIRALNSTDRFIIIQALTSIGFTRVGVYRDKNIIHADIDESKVQNVMWIY